MAGEQRPRDTAVADVNGTSMATARGGGAGTVLLALPALLLVGSAAGGARGRARPDQQRAQPAGCRRGRRRRRSPREFSWEGRLGAAVGESASLAEERRRLGPTVADGNDTASAAARGGGIGTGLLALIGCPLAGSAVGGGR